MFGKLINYWANQFITEKLVQNAGFQRLAAKTHEHVTNISQKGVPFVADASKRANTFAQTFKENLKSEAEKAKFR
ncbi:hypothetical protein K493DRAFT_314823 [Basidiobolus meristosporus CBS 931.73]|uniref:Uncharacterized protein n=1 Tax=Basidiobolus meristosporus CBS 931.73 TaxID=1314790 RepID=A0A1Y1YCS6_9FUNG|nr:hypothetical protein K493DRAFT_314823 [Basidiobolus meristosporus CBS 931.73]|eukprot:ORX95733.1 hypothetical protein K493DRAFT_314823 [Basidiobolus meristosporus CBS 931.73]